MADDTIPQIPPIVTRQEAVAAGLSRYFTGKPCKWGHIDERSTAIGGCLTCIRKHDTIRGRERWKDPEYRRKSKDWHDAWLMVNREKHNLDRRRKRATDPEYAATEKANKKLRRINDPEFRAKAADRNRAWRSANPEKCKANHTNGKARRRERVSGGSITANELIFLLDKQRRRCGYCRKSLNSGYHMDHIKPLAKEGKHNIKNIQLLCLSCNLRKSAKDPIVFANEIGLLV